MEGGGEGGREGKREMELYEQSSYRICEKDLIEAVIFERKSASSEKFLVKKRGNHALLTLSALLSSLVHFLNPTQVKK